MRKNYVNYILLLCALILLLSTPVFGKGLFYLPIHDNDVQINGGAWYYSSGCVASTEHAGIDFDGTSGVTVVYPAADGIVHDVDTSCSTGWGCYVKIKHDTDGDGDYDYVSMYNHLYEGSIAVSEGTEVTTNTQIALLGNTGNSKGEGHLDFRVGLYDGSYCDSTLWGGCWLDPYNLYDATTNPSPTCCDLPNGCETERAAAGRTDEFDCSNAETDADYLWATCYPTYDGSPSEDSESTSSETTSSESETCTEPDSSSVFSASPSSTTETPDEAANWPGVLEFNVSLSDSVGTFSVTKADGSTFESAGTMNLTVGTYESYGTVRDSVNVSSGNTTITFSEDDFSAYEWCEDSDYSKEYYVRYEADSGGYTVVGPITVTMTTSLAGDDDDLSLDRDDSSDSTDTETTDSSSDTATEDSTSTSSTDSDGDGLTDVEEATYGTETNDSDSDEDGLSDYDEVVTYESDPLDTDTDSDGLSDWDEVQTYGTSPTDSDSDDDGTIDGSDSFPLIAPGDIETIFSDSNSSTTSFGQAIAIDGDVVVIGATMEYSYSSASEGRGIVYVYRWGDSQWNLEAELIASDESYSNGAFGFGQAIAIDDDVIVVGARGDHYGSSDSPASAGSVYVYRYDETTGTWSEEDKLTSNNPQELEYFGMTVAVYDDVIAVSAPGYTDSYSYTNKYNLNLGAVYVFRYDGIDWDYETMITGTDDDRDYTPEKNFANNPPLALGEDLLLIGNYGHKLTTDTDGDGAVSEYSSAGGVYVYQWSGSTWTEETTLTASDGSTSDYFGSALALDEDTAIIGAYGDGSDTGNHEGSAYVFQLNDDGTWEQQAKLTASDGSLYDEFGRAVSISDDLIVIGTRNEQVSTYGYDIGKAYTFRWDGSTWEEEEIITPDGKTDTWRFGNKIAVSDELVLVGWSYNEKVYVYYSPDSDSDNDGLTDDEEESYGTNPLSSDTDSDSVSDYDEIFSYESDPTDADTDDDGLEDGEDDDPLTPLDTDGDGFSDVDEINTYSTDPTDADTDDDSLTDYDEVNSYSTDPNDSDSDDDGLTDYEESIDFEKLYASDGAENDFFASSVAIHGDLAVVGKYFDDEGADGAGAVYVYRYDGSSWNQETKLIASDAIASAYFGYAVDVEDDVIVVGAVNDDEYGSDAGAVYVYRYNSLTSAWDKEAKLTGNAVASAFFGSSVSLDGDLIVVGASNENPSGVNSGAAYMYHYDSTTWTQEAHLVPSDGESGDEFGTSVSVSNDVVLVGADRDDDGGTQSGSAYIYRYDDDASSWIYEQKITLGDDAAEGDLFGISVAVDGNTTVIGAYSRDEFGVDAGAAYVYEYDYTMTTWNKETTLTASDLAEGDSFGYAVAISSDSIIVGAPLDDDHGTLSGSAYLFTRDGSAWSEEKLAPSDGETRDLFGQTVAIYQDLILIGAKNDDDQGSDAGAAYIFDLSVEVTDTLDTDSDDDGVTDDVDICSSTSPLDASDTVNTAGCSLSQLDSDSDTLSDYEETLVYGTDPTDSDSDNDSLTDYDEVNTYSTDANDTDSDDDGINDGDEISKGTDPVDSDSDDDGLLDADDSNPLFADADEDSVADASDLCSGTTDISTVDANGCAASQRDTDSDGLTDEEESYYGTDTSSSDTDADSLSDYDEIFSYESDPTDADTDDDGLEDGEDDEPLTPLDTDDDGITDISDLCSSTSSLNSDDTLDANGCALSQLDSDSDSLTDYEETVTYGTDPNDSDTDNDSLDDDDEINVYATDPKDVDSDDDGLPDADDSNPLFADGDEDGIGDSNDLCPDTIDIATVDSDGCALHQRDSDTDGVTDDIDVCPSTSSLNTNDLVNTAGCSLSQLDSDRDSLTDYEEVYIYATDINDSDSDNDGLTDNDEVTNYSTNPNDADSDDDGFSDSDEVNKHGTDPNDATNYPVCTDTDGGFDYTKRGKVSGGTWSKTGDTYTAKTDFCYNLDEIKEFYCAGGHGYAIRKSCSALYGSSSYCSKGACVFS